MNSNPTQDNLLIQAYTPAGFKVSINLVGLPTAYDIDEHLKQLGYLNQLPGIKAGEEVEMITTVVRREYIDKKGQSIPVIDMYPAWRGDYGQFRFVGTYLDSADKIKEFEAQAGVKVDDLPLYESQGPLTRNEVRVSKYEVNCKPFRAKKAEDKVKEVAGKEQMTYRFAGYADAVHVSSEPESKPTGSNGGGVPESMGKLSERGKTTARPTFADNPKFLTAMTQYAASEGLDDFGLLEALNLANLDALKALPCDDAGRAEIKARIANFKAFKANEAEAVYP